MPPNPATTGAALYVGAWATTTGAGAGATTGVCTGTTGVAVVSVGVATLVPAVVAAPSFSCVLPYAVTPNTPPMATWNKPPPCNVIGTH